MDTHYDKPHRPGPRGTEDGRRVLNLFVNLRSGKTGCLTPHVIKKNPASLLRQVSRSLDGDPLLSTGVGKTPIPSDYPMDVLTVQ